MKIVLLLSILFPSVLNVNDDFKQTDLTAYTTLYRDSVQYTFDEILQLYNKGLFSIPADNDLTFPAGPFYYYVHYSVKNNSRQPMVLYSEIRNPHLNQVKLFSSDSIDYQESILSGDYYPFLQREIENRFFVFETKLDAGEQKDFFLLTNKYNESIKIPIIVRSKDNFIANSNYESTILGYYFGAILSIILASIIITVISPRRLYFIFIIYLVGFALFSYSHKGLGYQFLWGTMPLFNSLSRSFFAMITMVSILVFTYYFFEMKEEKGWIKKIHWSVTIYITINWGFHILYYSFIYYNSSLQDSINYYFLQSGVFVFPIYFLFQVFYQIVRKRYLKYYLFLLSTFGMLGAVAIMMLGQIGMVKDSFLLENVVLIALIVDFSVLAGILAFDLYRIKLNNQRLISRLDQTIADGAKTFLKGQQNERTRLAQEIHDGTGVSLSNIQMRLSSIETEDNTQRDRILDDLAIVSRDLRMFSHNLSSVVLEQYGLINAVEELILSLEEVYPNFVFEFEYGSITNIDKLSEKELYFIISELINNTIKHSCGNQIILQLKTRESTLLVNYMDNGIGLNVKNNVIGLGLKSIEWRLNILAAKMLYIKENNFNKYSIQIPI